MNENLDKRIITLLFTYCSHGLLDMFKSFFDEKYINCTTKYGTTLINRSILTNNFDITTFLLDYKIKDVSIKNIFIRTITSSDIIENILANNRYDLYLKIFNYDINYYDYYNNCGGIVLLLKNICFNVMNYDNFNILDEIINHEKVTVNYLTPQLNTIHLLIQEGCIYRGITQYGFYYLRFKMVYIKKIFDKYVEIYNELIAILMLSINSFCYLPNEILLIIGEHFPRRHIMVENVHNINKIYDMVVINYVNELPNYYDICQKIEYISWSFLSTFTNINDDELNHITYDLVNL